MFRRKLDHQVGGFGKSLLIRLQAVYVSHAAEETVPVHL